MIEIQAPQTQRNPLGAALKVAEALHAGAWLNLGAAAQHVIAAFHEGRGEATPATPEEEAWVWAHATLTTAMVQLLRDPRFGTLLDEQEIQKHVAAFVKARLQAGGCVDPTALTAPASLPLFAAARQEIHTLAGAVAPEHPFKDERAGELEALFRRALADAAAKVFAAAPDTFQKMKAALTDSMTGAMRIEHAWGRHATWVRRRFTRTPIFSINEDETTPLSHIYVPLRCFGHEDVDNSSDDSPDAPPLRRAHVADLHATLHHWLENSDRGDSLRVIAGGPGSGKSSFASAFATEVLDQGTHRVVFISMQHMPLSGDLYEDIRKYLMRRDDKNGPYGSPGLEWNPLELAKDDKTPVLLIFDGLDELTHSDDAQKELAHKFIDRAKALLRDQTQAGKHLRAIILGRSTACQEACKAADLPVTSLHHVAPLKPLSPHDLGIRQPHRGGKDEDDFIDDPCGLRHRDDREVYWARWCGVQGTPERKPPEAVCDRHFEDLNAEPLLLHLLLLSEYAEDQAQAARDNRSLVYENIISRIHKRNKTKEHHAAKELKKDDFFLLMECLGLAAWRGNARTGSDADFKAVRKAHAGRTERKFEDLPSAKPESVLLQIHARRDLVGGEGYEFIHKSFGEFLAARAVVSAAKRFATAIEDGEPEDEVAKKWLRLFAPCDMTDEIRDFVFQIARGIESADDLRRRKEGLTKLFNWTLKNGMPVNEDTNLNNHSFRDLERYQANAEGALLVVLSALATALCESQPSRTEEDRAHIEWPGQGLAAFRALLARLTVPGSPFAQSLCYLDLIKGLGDRRVSDKFTWNDIISKINLNKCNLKGAFLRTSLLRGADLTDADLTDADLRDADLTDADLTDADLTDADLLRADLRGANLTDADLRDADLTDADLTDADLTDADLTDANLSGADLTDAGLLRANLSGANLTDAGLYRANLLRANLSGANLTDANLSVANLTGADLTDADLFMAEISGAHLEGVKGLLQRALDRVFGDAETHLPQGFERPADWDDRGDG